MILCIVDNCSFGGHLMDRPLKLAIACWNVSHENFIPPLGSLSLYFIILNVF